MQGPNLAAVVPCHQVKHQRVALHLAVAVLYQEVRLQQSPSSRKAPCTAVAPHELTL